jgi:hypothetical protein
MLKYGSCLKTIVCIIVLCLAILLILVKGQLPIDFQKLLYELGADAGPWVCVPMVMQGGLDSFRNFSVGAPTITLTGMDRRYSQNIYTRKK